MTYVYRAGHRDLLSVLMESSFSAASVSIFSIFPSKLSIVFLNVSTSSDKVLSGEGEGDYGGM